MTPKFICLINSPHLLYLGFLTSNGCLPLAKNRFAPPSYVVYKSIFIMIMHFVFCEETLSFSEYWLQNIKLYRVSLVGRNKKKSRRQSLLHFCNYHWENGIPDSPASERNLLSKGNKKGLGSSPLIFTGHSQFIHFFFPSSIRFFIRKTVKSARAGTMSLLLNIVFPVPGAKHMGSINTCMNKYFVN